MAQSGEVVLTLFDTPYRVAVSDMIQAFRTQLDQASTPEERYELEIAIKSWTAALDEPNQCAKRGSKRSMTSSKDPAK